MANLPGSKQFIQTESVQTRRPVSEAVLQTIGASVNYLLDGGGQTIQTQVIFSNTTFTVRTDCNNLLILGWGAGSSGMPGNNAFYYPWGGWGGNGSKMRIVRVPCSPGQTFACTIGVTNGVSAGGDTYFGPYRFAGAGPTQSYYDPGGGITVASYPQFGQIQNIGGAGGYDGAFYPPGKFGEQGQHSIDGYYGGIPRPTNNTLSGGGGGAGPNGDGGTGGQGATGGASLWGGDAPANSGAGGGGGASQYGGGGPGGAGGSGGLIVLWVGKP